MDVIVADLDGGSITIPDGISLPLLPEPLLSSTQEALSLILQPELSCADHAFPPVAIRAPQAVMLDKEIRAVFMSMYHLVFTISFILNDEHWLVVGLALILEYVLVFHVKHVMTCYRVKNAASLHSFGMTVSDKSRDSSVTPCVLCTRRTL